MTATLKFYAVLFTVTSLGFDCKADLLPPVSDISYKWIDPFSVKLSWTWERPRNLTKGCKVRYNFYRVNTKVSSKVDLDVKTTNRYYSDSYLTGETGSGQWEVMIQVVGTESCEGRKSINKSMTVTTKKPKGQLVKDFKCVTESGGMNCSWIPLNPDLDVAMSYRLCETTEENIKSLKRCHRGYRDGMRNGCYLNILNADICFLVETASELKTFKPALVIPLPKMSIREDGEHLNLTWTTPEFRENCGWEYQVCYKECEKPCRTIQIPTEPTKEGLLHYIIDYNNECRYEFVFNVKSSHYCPDMLSDGSGNMTYGSNRAPVQPLKSTIVVAIVLSIVMSICLVLACYCFNRYRAIVCPNIPDPSAIFKEMMVNGNKDLKTTTSRLYTPMPEAIDPCKLTLVTENSALEENS